MYLKNISVYFIFNVISALLPVITLPIFTKYLSPADYGILAFFNIVSLLAGNFFRLELNAALKREYVDNKEFPKYVGTAFVFSTAQFLCYGVLLLFAINWVNIFHGITAPYFFLILLLAYLRFYTVTLHHLFQINNRALLFSVWGLITTLGTFGIAIGMIVNLGMQWQGRVWAEVIVALISFPFAIYFLRKDYSLKWQFEFEKLKSLIRFSFPLLCTSMMGYFLMFSDRLFIVEMVGARELGLYTVALQLSAAVGMMIAAVLPSWEAWIYARKGKIDIHEIKRISKKMLPVIGLLFLGLLMLPVVLQILLPYLTSKDYSGAELYLIPTIIAAVSSGIFSLIVPILIYMRKTILIAYINVGILVVNLVFQYFFIIRFGAVGAAYALAASYFIGSLSLVILIIKLNKIYIVQWFKSESSQ
jgi:O-antigen/teichoic acid export membrane protein